MFHTLLNDFHALRLVWSEYRELFGVSPSRIEIINEAGGLFARVVQDEVFDSVLMRLSRLSDPPRSNGKDNLTFRALIPLCPARIQPRLSELSADVEARVQFARN
jgi:hypothetical protein